LGRPGELSVRLWNSVLLRRFLGAAGDSNDGEDSEKEGAVADERGADDI